MKFDNDRTVLQSQLSLQFRRRPGRPLKGISRRVAMTVTVGPEFIAAIDRWAFVNDVSRSRAVELLVTSAHFIATDVSDSEVKLCQQPLI